MFPYDSEGYVSSLHHLGNPLTLPGWDGPVVQSAVPGHDNLYDSVGTWPYGSPPSPHTVTQVVAGLKTSRLVSFRAFFRPDANIPNEAMAQAGFEIVPLKEHFVFDPKLERNVHGARTRRNLRLAAKMWHVEPISLREYYGAIAAFHVALAARKQIGTIALVTPAHFAALAQLPAFCALGAFDGEGLGAALVTMQWENTVHLHALVGSERAYRTCGFYALYQDALDRWGQSHTIYLGGAPSGPDGPGIARFKSRFANRQAPVYMAKIVLDPDAYQRLTPPQNGSDWFPAYRGRSA